MTQERHVRRTARRIPIRRIGGVCLLIAIVAVAAAAAHQLLPAASSAVAAPNGVVRAMRLPVFARSVATPAATLPVAGTVHNTNRLLGHDGFVGVKTGSDNAAGGCFAFRAIRSVLGKRRTITGVVLGQPGSDRIDAGLAAADALVARIAGDRSSSSPPALGPPGALPRAHTQDTGRKPLRKTLLRPAALAVAVAVAAVGAGCGGSQSSTGSGTTATAAHAATAAHTSALTPRQKAVKFTECMRANGVGDFPDPDASGQFPSYGVSVTKAVWTRAVASCKSLQPPDSLSAKLTPAQESAALKFAQCVRANGVPDFPDPVNGQPLIDTTRIASANKPGGMTILNAATHKCGYLIAQQMGGR